MKRFSEGATFKYERRSGSFVARTGSTAGQNPENEK
jgi:hypothetical protein